MLPEEFDWRHILAGIVVLTIFAFLLSFIPATYVNMNPNIAQAGVIELEGPISYSSDVGSKGITPQHVKSLTEKAQNNGADVLIYEINSPGGAVVASKHAAQEVKNADVPTVCLVKEVAASGGYWIASACDKIVADSLSITGSIGVTSTYLEFSGLLEQYGVEYVNLTSGEFKDMGSPYKNLTEPEREKFDKILDSVHKGFIQAVAENRGLSEQAAEDVATGEVFLGQRAQELGLVDTLGSEQDAFNVAKNMTNATELKKSRYRPPQRFNFLSLLSSKVGEGIVEGLKNEKTYGIQARMP